MKTTPDDTEEQSRAVQPAAAVPGGKVLKRLELFDDQRGFAVNAPLIAPPPPAEPALPPGAAAAPPTRRRRKPAVGAFAATGVASLYLQGAQALAAPQAGPGPGGAAADAAAAPAWRSIGPTRVPNGQTYGLKRIDVAGRVAAVAVDPGNRNHVLCGSAGGGIWETLDGGANWLPRTDSMPTLTTGALAFDPAAPATVYAGTGEGDFYAGLGAGLLRSTDGGTTWAVRASAPFVGSGFHDLLVDPADGGHLLTATTNGLYVSSDGGAAWVRRRTSKAWAVSMHPAGGPSAELLAACADGLYRSTNGGQTWSQVSLPGSPSFWMRLAVDHARSNPAVAYAFGASNQAAFLYRRDAGGTWQPIDVPPKLQIKQAWYDWFLAAAPDRDDQVYLGAIDVHRGDLSLLGWHWTTLSSRPLGDSIHPDQHAIAFDPADAGVVYVGCDGGLYRSPDRGGRWQSLNSGLAITEMEYLAQDHGSSRWLIGGTQDIGTNRYRGDPVWDHAADGDGGDCGVNRSNPSIVYHSFYNMGLERSTARGDFKTFSGIGPAVPKGYGMLFYPPMECNADTVAQAGQSVFVSRNGGTNWTEVALPSGLVSSAMAMPTPDLVLVGTTNGRIFRIGWSGSAWGAASELASPRSNAWVSDLLADPGNLSRIWATCSTIGGGRVFRSDDGGSTWLDRTAGLPPLPINAVEVHASDRDRVWVAADLGVYQSFDGGATWSPFSTGLPNALVADLLYHPHAHVLRAGTRSRGVWEIPVDGWLEAPICGVQWSGTVPANAVQKWYSFRWPATWHVLWTVLPTEPRPGAPAVTWDVQVERADAEYATYWIAVTNLTADPLAVEGRYCILSFY